MRVIGVVWPPVGTTATLREGGGPSSPVPAISRGWPESATSAQSRPARAAYATAAAREGSRSFVRTLATWRCTVCGLSDEPLGDLGVAQPLRDEAQDLELARRELAQRAGRPCAAGPASGRPARSASRAAPSAANVSRAARASAAAASARPSAASAPARASARERRLVGRRHSAKRSSASSPARRASSWSPRAAASSRRDERRRGRARYGVPSSRPRRPRAAAARPRPASSSPSAARARTSSSRAGTRLEDVVVGEPAQHALGGVGRGRGIARRRGPAAPRPSSGRAVGPGALEQRARLVGAALAHAQLAEPDEAAGGHPGPRGLEVVDRGDQLGLRRAPSRRRVASTRP